jgi:probable HAF family extracellular repeat protein
MIGLGDLPGGDFNSYANAVSADGSTVVGVSKSANGINEGFRWTSSGGMVGFGNNVIPASVSADGSVIVGASIGYELIDGRPGGDAFRWTSSEGIITLGNLGFSRSYANAVSPDGSVVVGSSSILYWHAGSFSALPEAFRWTEATGMVGLGDLEGGGDPYSGSMAVSADGSVVVGWGKSASGVEAFIWDATNGMRELDQVLTSLGADLTGWQLTDVFDISDDGRAIVGSGTNPAGLQEAWIATIPEPSTGLLVLTGLLGLASRRRGCA